MDLQVVETGNGGDLNSINQGNDLNVVFSFENMPYLAMFGGNVEASTTTRIESEQAFDYWANSLLWPNDESVQFNSITERRLKEVPLTSSGRLRIEEGIYADLAFMKPFANVSVSTKIISDDVLQIDIAISRPDNLEEKRFIYIWEAGQITFINTDYVPNTYVVDEDGLQYELQFYL